MVPQNTSDQIHVNATDKVGPEAILDPVRQCVKKCRLLRWCHNPGIRLCCQLSVSFFGLKINCKRWVAAHNKMDPIHFGGAENQRKATIVLKILCSHSNPCAEPAAATPTRESQCNVRLALESYWYAAHSGSQRSQCKSIEILLVRRISSSWFFCVLLVHPIGTPHVRQCWFQLMFVFFYVQILLVRRMWSSLESSLYFVSYL